MPFNTVQDGVEVTLECSVTGVPYKSTPFVQLLGPRDKALANSTSFTLTYTLNPVRTVDAGRYICSAVLEVGMNMTQKLDSSIGYLKVEGNDIISCHI